MVWFTILFIVVLFVSEVTSFSCSNKDKPGPASCDDDPVSQKLTALQYCYIDNCTIMRTTLERSWILFTLLIASWLLPQ